LKEIYHQPRTGTEEYQSVWVKIVAKQIVGETHAKIDGTFELPLTSGSFYLYAYCETDYSVVEWFIPLTVQGSERLKIDLQNSNASFIGNK